ncbi:jg8811 [Pararge aegeria aegeria]|uniref:Jg8811 protein n=2 Tax=Pararge aegeria TaxID=116150 RepID=A0A8S4S2N8_9NEOP|nr:jg8811 [Pararge aegeria aegeria]
MRSLFIDDVDVGALVTVCTLAVTLMLIYGASRGKPAHLLPFFCLQIFDFAITVDQYSRYKRHALGKSVCKSYAMEAFSPAEYQPAKTRGTNMMLIVTILKQCHPPISPTTTLTAYFISVVWRCYKFLTMRTHAMHAITPYVIASSRSRVLPCPPPTSGASAMPAYSSLLPDYEEAVKQTPPPSYRAATLMTSDPADAANPTQAPKEQNQPPVSNTVVMLPPLGEQVRV